MRSSILFCLFFFFSIHVYTQNAKPNDGLNAEEQYNLYFKKADELLGKYEFEESIRNCEKALKYKPNDHLVRAVICLDYYEIAEKLDVKKADEKEWKLDIYKKMAAIAEEGMNAAPEKGECYFMRGLANARMSTTKGILSSLFSAKQIEQDWLVAVSRKSDYVTPNGENLEASANIAWGFIIDSVLHFSYSNGRSESAAIWRKRCNIVRKHTNWIRPELRLLKNMALH